MIQRILFASNNRRHFSFACVGLSLGGFLVVTARLHGAVFVPLGDLPGGIFKSEASSVSSDGSVVVGYSVSSSGLEAFRWTEATGMVGLGDLPGGGFFSYAYGVSSDGSVVVGRGVSSSGYEAFVWDAVNGMRSVKEVLEGQGIDLSGWSLATASSVSADGEIIVGTGINPNGQTEAWLARISPASNPVPEPGTMAVWSLFVLCGSVVAGRRKSRQLIRRNR